MGDLLDLLQRVNSVVVYYPYSKARLERERQGAAISKSPTRPNGG